LEKQVAERTDELKQSLDELKATQHQLIQSEKMASLGELTAGIAHEIQNPLNFVNNFSELSEELMAELEVELKDGNETEVKNLTNNIKQNLQKIAVHGKRADAIVKGMLLHSRTSTGNKEPVDLNTFISEYLQLSYHGLRAKDKSFNATIITNFDPAIEKVLVVPQDFGRMLLNIFNNAFYAVTEKKKEIKEGYEPTITVSTKFLTEDLPKPQGLEIRIRDNGTGIPEKHVSKVFQPFFTTKPGGKGTGLGLSLSYDIITQGHGGRISVETKKGEFAEFIIYLPI
jgi:signal transduction histidine kinase